MSCTTEKTLSGLWTGVFDYASGWGEATPFNAWITETERALTGEVIEPNTVAADAIPEIFASIVGERVALDVSFVKTYEPLTGVEYQVDYSGVCDPDLRTIRGEWTIEGGRCGRGPFVMNRSASGAEAAAETASELTALIGASLDTLPKNS